MSDVELDDASSARCKWATLRSSSSANATLKRGAAVSLSQRVLDSILLTSLVLGLSAAGSALGQTGNGGSGDPSSPTVSAVSVDAGLIHTCALTGTGRVKCWGSNYYLQLGNRSIGYSTTPTWVSSLSGAIGLAIGQRHGCALTLAGGLKCWGENRYGQLGNGIPVLASLLVDVSGLNGGVTAATAGFHTCALTTTGTVTCWGSNNYGQVGDGTTEDRSSPVAVAGLNGGVTAISAGDSDTCALMTTGGVKCWGDNSAGQLGDGTTVDRWRPVDVSGLPGAVKGIAAGGLHTCALTTAGGVECWGDNSSGQLGDGTTRDRLHPVPVSGLRTGVTTIVAGLRHTCALTRVGDVKCWGLNDRGQLGDGSFASHSKPVNVSGLGHAVIAITAGGWHSCAVLRAGSVSCWGYNVVGELGDATEVDRQRPVRVVGFGPALAKATLVSRSVTVARDRIAGIQLRCSPATDCRGRIALSATARRRHVWLGVHRFSVLARRSATVKVRLTIAGARLLCRVKRLPTKARISYLQRDGSTTVAVL